MPGRPADKGGLRVVYWKRYEIENYVVTPDVLRHAVAEHYGLIGANSSM